MKINFTIYTFVITELLLDADNTNDFSVKDTSLNKHKNILKNDNNKRKLYVKTLLSELIPIKKEFIKANREIEISYLNKNDETKIEKINLNNLKIIYGIKSIINAKYVNDIDITYIMKHLLNSEMVPKLLNLNPPTNTEYNKVIPIGNRCMLAGILRRMHLHGESLPFDNLASSPRLLQPFFNLEKISDFYLPYKCGSNTLMHNGLHFVHFNYNSNKDKYNTIKESFNRKFKRLFSILNNKNNNVLFVFADIDSVYKNNPSYKYYKELLEFDKFIKNKYSIKYTILCFHINEQYEDTETIKNYTIKLANNENRNNLSGFYNLNINTGDRYLWNSLRIEICKILKYIKIV